MLSSISNFRLARRAAAAAAGVLALVAAAGCASKSTIGVSTGVSTAQGAQLDLVARVKTALLNDEIVGRRRIDVQATLDDVRLTGRVESAAERDRAVQIARGVPGVRTVTSNLDIRP